MAKRLSKWFCQFSKGWIALLSLIVFLVFTALMLPGQSAMVEAYSKGLGSPDTTFVYSMRKLYAMAEAYGAAGRQAYIHARFSFDLVFPLVYTFFLAVCTSWLLGRALPQTSPWRLLNLFPLTAMGFDYLENIATAVVMSRYPTLSPAAAFLAPPLTFIKWLLVIGSFIALVISLILFLARRKKIKKRG